MLNLALLTFTSFVVALSGAVVPGPVFVVTVSESLRRGSLAGPLIVVGHLILEAFIIGAILMGLNVVLASAGVRVVIGYVGGVTLILMGLFLLRTARSFRMGSDLERAESGLVSHGLVAAGFLSSGSNPHFFLWWVTIGLPTMQYCISMAGVAGIIAFIIGHAAGDLFWFGLVSYSIDKGKKLLNERAIRYIIGGSALFLIGFGITFIYQTILA